MKYALLVAAVLAFSAPALAADESKEAATQATSEAATTPAAVDFAKLDANTDGALSKEEFDAAKLEGKTFEAADADKDGKVTAEELAK
jgi:Ca2+-binding EF-hand superfamily protein